MSQDTCTEYFVTKRTIHTVGVLSREILWRVNIEDIQIKCHLFSFLVLVYFTDDVVCEF